MSYIPLKRKLATSVNVDSRGFTIVRLYDTAVVTFDKDSIFLNTGGWYTSTTKKRINQASVEFGLGIYVFQKDGEWFVKHQGKVQNFIDGALISRLYGEVLS